LWRHILGGINREERAEKEKTCRTDDYKLSMLNLHPRILRVDKRRAEKIRISA